MTQAPDRSAGVRIASWPPWYDTNPYLKLFYEALSTYGIEHVGNMELDVPALVAAEITAVHLHWAYPIWRPSPRNGIRQLFRIHRLHRFIAALRRADIQLLWTVHNLAGHEATGVPDRIGHRLLHRSAHLRIVHSDAARASLHEHYGRGGPVIVMPHGNYDGVLPPAQERSITRARLGIPPGRRLLLCFGQIRPYKGFDVAIAALGLLPHDDYHLVMAGRPVDGRIEPGPRISLIARHVEDQELADLLHACDAVLLPYRSVTGSGVLLQALTAGRAVVASDLPYFAEVLACAPAAGVLHAPGDPAALADAIVRFFGDDVLDRHAAARRIASEAAWSSVVVPVVDWLLRSRCGGGDRSDVAAGGRQHQADEQLPSHRIEERGG